LLGIPLTIHIYRTCINQALIDTAYILGLWPRLRLIPNKNRINFLFLFKNFDIIPSQNKVLKI
jgi:hypothetical protein